MASNHPQSSLASLRVFLILTVFLILCGCASKPPANVEEHSKSRVQRGHSHTVQKGETLFSIAWKYGLEYRKLADFNGINPPYRIYPTQKIWLDLPPKNLTASAKNSAHPAAITGSKLAQNSPASASGGRSKINPKNDKRPGLLPDSSSKIAWLWPCAGKLFATFQGDIGLNKGIDLSGKLGEPVLAAASGQVVYAGSGLSGYGNLLIIKHSDVFLSAYAHNKEMLVKEGDFVKAGQQIADMGSSGTDRVKLHFEIRSEGSPVDPLKFLPKR